MTLLTYPCRYSPFSLAFVESALKSAAMTTSNKSKDARTIAREYVASF